MGDALKLVEVRSTLQLIYFSGVYEDERLSAAQLHEHLQLSISSPESPSKLMNIGPSNCDVYVGLF